jgi:hypothetical protein
MDSNHASGGFLRWFDFSKKTKERKFAEIAALEILSLYASEKDANPNISGRSLYKRVVSKYLKITDAEANQLVLGAKQSYADWPEERDLRLNDVARYIVITRYVETRGVKYGVGPDISEVVLQTIPNDL